MAILGGRRFAMHGIEPGDMVLVTYSLGLGNGGMAPREALWRYTGSVPVIIAMIFNLPACIGLMTPERGEIAAPT